MITISVVYQKSSRGIDVLTLLSIGLLHPINRFSIILKFEVITFFCQKKEKSSKDGD